MTDKDILKKLVVAAKDSPDPSTQNAACLYDPNLDHLFAPRVNRFPQGVKDTPARWERPGKYDRVIHAEVNAIIGNARKGWDTKGLWLYAVWAACGPCASAIVESGIKKLITLESSDPDWKGVVHDKWADSIRIGFETMREAGMEIVFIAHPVADEGMTILRNGEEFRP